MYLDEFAAEKKLQLNFIRLALASLVLLFHAAPIGGYVWDMSWPTLRPSTDWGGFAVGGFFSLSGFLMAMSARRHDALSYFYARVLRIFPAFITVILFSALFLSPAIWYLQHGQIMNFPLLTQNSALGYITHNLSMQISSFRWGIGDVFIGTPYGELTGISVINGSLWSIRVEFRCYILAFVLVNLRQRFKFIPFEYIALSLAALFTIYNQQAQNISLEIIPEFITFSDYRWVSNFLIGLIIGMNAHRIPIGIRLWTLTIFTWFSLSAIGGVTFQVFGLGIACMLILSIARALPNRYFSLFSNDISYGVYLWAFPVQQTLSFLGFNSNPVWYVLLSLSTTIVIASMSWKFVEKPTMAFRSKYVGKRTI